MLVCVCALLKKYEVKENGRQNFIVSSVVKFRGGYLFH